MTSFRLNLSQIDEDRFGVRTARAYFVTPDKLTEVMDFCRSNQVKFLIARCHVDEIQAAQAMEEQGFLLMDTLVYFSRPLRGAPIPEVAEGITIRPVQPHEAEQVSQLAAKVFQGYAGHYHADLRLNRADCDAVYQSWAYNSCIARDLADEVLVAERQGQIVGFITLRIHNNEEGEGPLYGVDPSTQGQGIGRSLMIGALRWFEAKQMNSMFISTQITNLSSQKVWLRLGFEPIRAEYTFHKWFD